ncbi:MAG: cache domain-containing protein [Roseiarcus sp.]
MLQKGLVFFAVGAAALSLASGASAAGTADDAKALLAKAVAALEADKGALAKFDDPNGGFKVGDLYVFCFDRKSGVFQNAALKGKDARTVKDSNGKLFGQEMFDNVKDGAVITVDYMFPKPGTTDPVAKESFVEGIGDLGCGVGYYK